MTAWIDSPNWSDPHGRRLRQLLEENLWRVNELQDLWETAGLSPAEIAWQGSAKTIWAAMLKTAPAPKLRLLVELVAEQAPAAANALREILAVEVAGAWYVAPDAFSAYVLGLGLRSALIDRAALRECLRQMEQDNYLVLAISGDSGSGKSHSRHLIRHVAQCTPARPAVVTLSVEDEWSSPETVIELNAAEFARVLALKLGVDTSFIAAVDVKTEATRIAKDLAIGLAERYRNAAPPPRWVFIDGLDRPGVLDDVRVFVAHLALAAAEDELGAARLIVTGHSGAFAQAVDAVLVSEKIDEIAPWHVERFFQDIAGQLNRRLGDDEAAQLATTALRQTGVSDLRELERIVVRMARERFAGQ
jgi:hypothetical protein